MASIPVRPNFILRRPSASIPVIFFQSINKYSENVPRMQCLELAADPFEIGNQWQESIRFERIKNFELDFPFLQGLGQTGQVLLNSSRVLKVNRCDDMLFGDIVCLS